MSTDTEAALRSLVETFMAQERVTDGLALHIIVRVAQALGARTADELLETLARIEAETKAQPGEYAGEGIRQSRIVRSLYDQFVLSLTPAGHAACAAVLYATMPADETRH